MSFIGVCTKCFAPVYHDKRLHDGELKLFDTIIESCKCNAPLVKRSGLYYYYVFPFMVRLVLTITGYLIDPALGIGVALLTLVISNEVIAQRKKIDESQDDFENIDVIETERGLLYYVTI